MGTKCVAGEHAINAEGVALCNKCVTTLEGLLKQVPDVWVDVHVSARRMDVGAPSVGSSGGHAGSQEPANLEALDRAQTLRVRLSGWASLLPQLHPFGEPPLIAAWLLTQMPTIRKMEWAGDLLLELQDSLQECRAVTDRAAERLSLGVCGNEVEGVYCGGAMMSIVGGRLAKCRTCGATDSSHERQQWLISEAWHVQAFLPDITRWLTQSGHARIEIKKARNWVNAGKLEPDACDVSTRRHLFTPAAVMATYRQTPTGRRHDLATREHAPISA